MRLLKATRGRALCAIAAVALLATACSNAGNNNSSSSTTSKTPSTTNKGNDLTKNVPVSAKGVTSTEIHVGSITSKTNPLGGDEARLNDGIKAYFDVVNNTKGGIYGRKLKLTSERDDQTGNNATETEAMLSQDNVYAVFEAVELMSGAPKLAAAGIPTFGWNINPEWAGPKNFFPNVAPICFSGCAQLPHVTPWLAEQSHAKNVAILGYNVPQAAGCVKGNQQSFKNFGDKVGAHIVYSDASLNFGQTDFSPQVSQMKAKNVDFLVTCVDFNGDYAIAKEMVKQGINKKVTFLHANMYNPEFVAKNAGPLEGGLLGVDITAVEQTPPAPGVKDFLDYMSAHPNIKVSELTMQGWVAAQQFYNALVAAGPDFTWANLVGAWNQTKWYTGDGWITPLDWTTQHEDISKAPNSRPFECENFLRIHNGKFEPAFAEPGKPWVCFDGTKPTTWMEPTHVSFASATPFTYASTQK